MAGWNADTAAGPLGAGAVTLVEGSSFCISLANGDIHPEHPHGVFVLDTRILSGWSLTINGQPLEPLAAETKEPYRALFAGRAPRLDGYADSPLIVERLREVGAGIQEQITVRNYSLEPAECVISLRIEADFADLFEVKEARIQRRWDETRQAGRRRADHPGRLAGRPEGRRDPGARSRRLAGGPDVPVVRPAARPVEHRRSPWCPAPTGTGPAASLRPCRRGRTVSPGPAPTGSGWQRFRCCRWATGPSNGRCGAATTTWAPFASRTRTIRSGSWWPPARPGS